MKVEARLHRLKQPPTRLLPVLAMLPIKTADRSSTGEPPRTTPIPRFFDTKSTPNIVLRMLPLVGKEYQNLI